MQHTVFLYEITNMKTRGMNLKNNGMNLILEFVIMIHSFKGILTLYHTTELIPLTLFIIKFYYSVN